MFWARCRCSVKTAFGALELMKFTEEQNWDRFKKFYFEFPAVGLSIDLSRTRIEGRFFDEMQPKLKAVSMPGSVVQVKFTRGQMDGVVNETKLDNAETWTETGRYFTLPAELVIPTNAQNLPRSVQMRARYVEGNTPVGLYSQVDTVATLPSA